MCGIAGILNLRHQAVDIHVLMRMSDTVRHRGPDDQGAVLISPDAGVPCHKPIAFKSPKDLNLADTDLSPYAIGLAHRRLSIIDLSKNGHQPMTNDDDSLWVVHNGEIYNYLEIREKLLARGYRFKSQTDTEMILYAYKEWGVDCLARFNGMWAFALWDGRTKRLFCSRDRFGVKPFYYYFDGHVFLFASEIKQILEHPAYRKKANDLLIYDYLVVGQEDHTEETFFDGIRQLRGGEFAILDFAKKEFAKERYYDLNHVQVSSEDEPSYYRRFQELFFDAVRLRLRSDVPVGSCLSGGLDSSSVVCTISRLLKDRPNAHPVETFTASWPNEAIDEKEYAREVVTSAGANGNYVYPSSEELREDLSKLVWHQEEPFGSLSIFAQWAVMKKAREKGIPVLLDGQGGDEVFLGYERYYAWFLMGLLKKGKWKKSLKELLNGAKNSRLNLAEMAAYYLYFNNRRIRAFHLNRRAKTHLDRGFAKEYDAQERIKNFQTVKNVFDLQRLEIQETQLTHLLKYADRNSMAFAIESRLPFLDYRLVEFALGGSPEMKIKNGWTKNVIREGLKGIIPEKIRTRKIKIGFEVPQKKLLLSLLPRCKETFEDGAMSGKYIQTSWLREKIKSQDIGGVRFWKALSLELWLRTFFG